jgi:chloride channel 7
MLANHIQNGIESARVAWSRIPNSDESQFVDEDGVGLVKKNDGSAVESLDYEVIENFAYREEQVLLFFLFLFFMLILFLLLINYSSMVIFIGVCFEIFRSIEEGSCM